MFANCSYTCNWGRTIKCIERHFCKCLRRFVAGRLCHVTERSTDPDVAAASTSVFSCQSHSTIAPHSLTLTHSSAGEAARCLTCGRSIQLMQAGDLAHPGLSPKQFSYSHVATRTVLYVHNSYFLNHKTVPLCVGLCLYLNGVPDDPAVVRWSA